MKPLDKNSFLLLGTKIPNKRDLYNVKFLPGDNNLCFIAPAGSRKTSSSFLLFLLLLVVSHWEELKMLTYVTVHG